MYMRISVLGITLHDNTLIVFKYASHIGKYTYNAFYYTECRPRVIYV